MKVTIGSFVINEANVVNAIDGSMTISFEKGTHTLSEIDSAFVNAPKITLEDDGVVSAIYYNKAVQAYRVEGENIEVSFKVSVAQDNTITNLQTQVAQLQTQLASLSASADAESEETDVDN